MGKFLYLFIVVQVIACSSSVETTEELMTHSATDSVFIHFQGGFDKDTVMITVNDSIIYDNVISSDRLLGFADSFTYLRKFPTDSILIIIVKDGKVEKLTISPEDGIQKYIGVYYTSNKGIVKYYRDTPFVYE